MYNVIEDVLPLLKDKGFEISNPWDIVDAFESIIADFAGSKYAVSCDSCTNAMFLSLKYLQANRIITIPEKTYISVPGLIVHAGCKIKFKDIEWSGVYQLEPYPVIDGAARFTKNMYMNGKFHCLSFHIKKILPICKGGMILTDDQNAANWFKLARYEGRDNRVNHDQINNIEILGWNNYMPPEQAARGILLFNTLPQVNDDSGGSWSFQDISKYSAWSDFVVR